MCEINFGKKLMELRMAKGITQEQLAADWGISNKTISKWENDVSGPDLAMLVKIADYFDISTDALLGRKEDKKADINAVIENEFKDNDMENIILKSFQIAEKTVVEGIQNFRYKWNQEKVIPPTRQGFPRSAISSPNMYHLFVNSDDVNMSVMLLRNKSNFSWLDKEENKERIASLFQFLADKDALKICSFIHNNSFSESFTAEFMAKNAGIDVESAEKILEKACEIKLCKKDVAHLKTGKVTVYASYGEGSILALITLAYEYMCGLECYHHCYGEHSKMIGGKEV